MTVSNATLNPSTQLRIPQKFPTSPLKSEKNQKAERKNPRTAQSFCVPKADIAAQGYDLSLNRYKEVVHEEVTHRKPGDILKALDILEAEIQNGMKELKGMLK